MECWVPVIGYEGRYQVSDIGQVRNARTLVVLRPRQDAGGYVRVVLYCGSRGTRREHLVHRLVCRAFHGIAPIDRQDVNHLNGLKTDNRPANREWTNDSLNVSHAIRELGTPLPPGCKYWLGKFDAENPKSKPVLRIADNGEIKRYPSASAASREGYSFRHISAVCLGKRQRHAGYSWRFEEQST